MKTFEVSTSGMQKHITGKNYSEKFETMKEALKAFDYQCERLDYTNIETYDDGSKTAGGIGHDYRISIDIIDND